MSREPSRRMPRERSVGSAGSKTPRNMWFVVGMAAVAVSVIVLLAVVTNAIGGSGDDDGDTPVLPGDETETVVSTPAATNTPPTRETPVPPTNTAPAVSPTPTTRPGEQFPRIDCLDIYAPADKKHIMSPDCAPSDLIDIPGGERMRREAGEALIEMMDDAEAEGIVILAVSGYRSYQTQEQVYASAVAGYGQEYADRTSARPGHSEHQLGTVMDLSTPSEGGQLEESFGETPAGRWVAENSYKYGFIISYPQGSEPITGYSYEPWHVRYLRKDVAKQIFDRDTTITEYLAGR